MSLALFVKICGVTNPEDAVAAVDLGATAIGINLIAASKRFVTESAAKEMVAAITGRAMTVAVVADLAADELGRIKTELGFDRLQLHGAERPDLVSEVPGAFKAVSIASADDVRHADSFACDPLLLDAKVPGALGGTGVVFDWSLVVEVSRRRPILLAGGLTPYNVAEAVRLVAPWGVDVSSGVEQTGNPRRKDAGKMRAFIDAARQASNR